MNGSDPKETVRKLLSEAHPALIGLSHWMHANPELGYEEVLASGWVAEWLVAAGFEVERGVGRLETAVRGTFGPGPFHVAVCAEYDALPGVGHACGHNVIAATSVGAAIALASVADELGLRVTLLGTPAEEGGGGKIQLIDAGAFDGVHAALMVHPGPDDIAEPEILAVQQLEISYTGREAHAAGFPELGVNAADALVVAQVAIGLLRQHLNPGDRVHGIVTKGGDAPNVVPAHTSARYMTRSATREGLVELTARIRNCFEAGALATGAALSFVEGVSYADMRHDPDLVALYRRNAEELGRRFDPAARMTVSTDMGDVSHVVPSIHPMIGIGSRPAVNHQPEFADAAVAPEADQAVFDGALLLAWTAIDAASDAGVRERLMGEAAPALALVETPFSMTFEVPAEEIVETVWITEPGAFAEPVEAVAEVWFAEPDAVAEPETVAEAEPVAAGFAFAEPEAVAEPDTVAEPAEAVLEPSEAVAEIWFAEPEPAASAESGVFGEFAEPVDHADEPLSTDLVEPTPVSEAFEPVESAEAAAVFAEFAETVEPAVDEHAQEAVSFPEFVDFVSEAPAEESPVAADEPSPQAEAPVEAPEESHSYTPPSEEAVAPAQDLWLETEAEPVAAAAEPVAEPEPVAAAAEPVAEDAWEVAPEAAAPSGADEWNVFSAETEPEPVPEEWAPAVSGASTHDADAWFTLAAPAADTGNHHAANGTPEAPTADEAWSYGAPVAEAETVEPMSEPVEPDVQHEHLEAADATRADQPDVATPAAEWGVIEPVVAEVAPAPVAEPEPVSAEVAPAPVAEPEPVSAEVAPAPEVAPSNDHSRWEQMFAAALAEIQARQEPAPSWEPGPSEDVHPAWDGAEADSWSEAARLH